jgi:hypothetical protein
MRFQSRLTAPGLSHPHRPRPESVLGTERMWRECIRDAREAAASARGACYGVSCRLFRAAETHPLHLFHCPCHTATDTNSRNSGSGSSPLSVVAVLNTILARTELCQPVLPLNPVRVVMPVRLGWLQSKTLQLPSIASCAAGQRTGEPASGRFHCRHKRRRWYQSPAFVA